jgi:alpha-L-fucosidase
LNQLAVASSFRGNAEEYNAVKVNDGNKDTYWATNDEEKTGSVEIDLGKPQLISYVVIQEYIKLGQRVKNFRIEIVKDGKWVALAKGTTIGYKRIVKTFPTEAQKIRLVITDSKACPTISNMEVY